MSEGIIILLALAACLLAAMAVAISVLVISRLSAMRQETTKLGNLIYFADMESRKRKLLVSSQVAEESLERISNDSRRLTASLSKVFADVARLLNETHKLEGNPHPKIDSNMLRDMNERLLSVGETSLIATRIAEKLGKDADELKSGIHSLREDLGMSEESTQG